MKMNKIIVIALSILVILGAIIAAFIITKRNESDVPKKVVTKVAEEEILDECTEEYENLEKNEVIKTNAGEEKTSPNCSLITKTYYKDCQHTKEQYSNLPADLVNMTKKELQEKYQNYKIEKFESNEVDLYQEKDGECGEHYLVKEKEGKVVIYQVKNDGSEVEYEETGIATEYLTQTDKINIEKGIRVNGKQKLNQLIEDFE